MAERIFRRRNLRHDYCVYSMHGRQRRGNDRRIKRLSSTVARVSLLPTAIIIEHTVVQHRIDQFDQFSFQRLSHDGAMQPPDRTRILHKYL